MGSTEIAEAARDALDDEVTSHFIGNACRSCDPTDDIAGEHVTVVTIEREGDAYDVAVPAGKLEAVRARPDIGAQRDDTAAVLARPAATGMAREQQSLFLHRSIDALGINRRAVDGQPLALEEDDDASAATGRSGIDETSDLGLVGAGNAKDVGDLHRAAVRSK